MPAQHPQRTRTFRLITIAAAGLGSLMLGLWALKFGFGHASGVSAAAVGSTVLALCVLASSGTAVSYFAGVDESANYVFKETQVDKLTGLAGRTAMFGRVAEAVSASIRSGRPAFLIDIEIDRFRQINDSIGYVQSDELIAAFADRLRSSLPAGLQIGRIGAGEFAAIYPDGNADFSLESEVERLIETMAEPYQLKTHLQSVNLSVGIVAIPKDGRDPALLLRRSNLALQQARMTGLCCWSIFQPEMGQVADYRQWVEAELHTAFERCDFELHYQPQLDLTSGRVIGYEALIRWAHPQRGMIPPMEFIPIAEETGMIAQVGEWVLHRACSDARHLPDDCFVAVNISPVQFMTKDFLGVVRKVIESTRIKPSRLELEITETAMMQDRDRAAAILKALSEMGISVAVDDFGTGYSNLSYLIDFPFHKLKIDRSFVSRIDTDSSTGAVVSTIVGLSRALGVHTIAEGVETESQATLLRAAGCEVVQGYFYGKPAPLVILQGMPTAVHQTVQ